MSPSEACRRWLLNQAMYSTMASSSWAGVRQTRSAISSVLKLSTNDLGERVVVRVADRSDRREDARGRRASGCSRMRCIASRRRCDGSARRRRPGSRRSSAIRSASRTRSVRMCAASCQPTIIAAVGVDDEREVDDALPAAQVGEVGDPQLVRRRRGEVALDEIGPAGAPAGPAWSCATASRAASRPGCRCAHQPLTRPRPTCSPARSSAFHIRR